MNSISECESLDLTIHLKPYIRDDLDKKPCVNVSELLTYKMLPKSYFLEKISFEKRRADRSKSSLSIVIFHFNVQMSRKVFKLFAEYFYNVRDTDILGYLGEGIIGLLLPDTDKEGAKRCIEKIANGFQIPPFTTIAGTYPDDIFDTFTEVEKNQLNIFPLFLEELEQPTQPSLFLKRGIDILGALVGIVLFSPIMLLTALAIKATSPGPAIFRQIRLGHRCVPFQFYKFRSMSSGVDDQIHREYVSNLINGNLEAINQGEKEKPLYKIKADPRVTWVGRIIRKTSIDELPQFFNVLKGDMSLVGPRPPLPYEAENYQSWHLRRILEMNPGITGLWQVEGRSKTSFDDMVRLDLQYCRGWSLLLDLKILIKTVKVVIQSAGAF